LLLALFFTKSITQRIELLQENATLLANKEKLHALLSGNDEIAVLDRAFHSMADTLEEAARRERALVDNALDVICTVDDKRTFAAVSPAAAKVWGYTPDELVGKPVESIVEQTGEPMPLDASQIGNQGADLQFENKIRHKSGTTVSMLWSAHWSELDKVFFCVAHDITDRKAAEEMLRESEARLRTVMESMPVALVIANDKGLIEVTNKTTEDLLGYSYSDLVGKSIAKLLPDEKEQGENLIDLLAERYLNRHGELPAQRKNGEKLEVELSLSEIYFRGERNFLLAMLDINERHEMELLKQEFINMMSNDLKQPLVSVRSVLSTLSAEAAGKLNEKGKMLVDQSEREAVRLVRLINELLDAEKLQSGKMQLEIKEHCLKEIVARSLESVAVLAEKSQVKVEDRCAPRRVQCDDTRVIQVLINLISNSLKFSPSGSTISVADKDAGDYCQIAVTDQGRGIPEALRKGVFEKFVQVEAGDAKVKGGTGLGLAICKAIVEGHGGTIGVDSEEGKGSTFWFRLPKA
jgi:PAS domain S-box-containing protein